MPDATFAFNATNTVRQTRKRWIDLFADYGARVELVYVEPPLPIIFQQNERRAKPVPNERDSASCGQVGAADVGGSALCSAWSDDLSP